VRSSGRRAGGIAGSSTHFVIDITGYFV